MSYFSSHELWRLANKERVDIGRDSYLLCWNCFAPVRVNKFLFGGFHICGGPKDLWSPLPESDEEAKLWEWWREKEQEVLAFAAGPDPA